MTRPTVSSLDSGLRLLQALVDAGGPIGVTKLSAVLHMDKSMVHRILSTLKAGGYVFQDEDTRKYELGSELVALSGKVLRSGSLEALVRPSMRELRELTGETVHLARLLEDRAVYIGREDGIHLVTVTAHIGQREPLYCTATGKVLLAFLPDRELQAALARMTLVPHTPQTMTSKDALHTHLIQVRKQGFAMDDMEFHEGVRCLAAPVRDYNGAVLAALGISGPIMRMTTARVPELSQHVMRCAAEASARFGYASGQGL